MSTLTSVAGVGGGVLFTLVWAIEGARRPGFRPAYHPISALSLGPAGWVQAASFTIAGCCLVVVGVGGWAGGGGVVGGAGLLVPGLVAIAGLGLVGAGVFPMDPMRGYPAGAPAGDPPAFSRAHQRHDQASVLFLAGVPVAAAASGVTGRGVWSVASLGVAVAGLVLLVRFGAAYERDAPRSGVTQRVLVTVLWAWVAALGLRW